MKIYIEGGDENVPGLKQLSNELYGKVYASRGLRNFYYGFTPYTSGYEEHFCQITFEVEGTAAQLEFLRIVDGRFKIIRVDAEDVGKEGEAIAEWSKDHEQRPLPKEMSVPKDVAEALAELEDAHAAGLIAAALGDSRSSGEAMEAVGELGEVALAPLLVALEQNDDYLVRMRAAIALGKLGDARAVVALGVAVKDDDEWPVRQEAADALGELGDARAVDPLIAALREKKGNYSYEVQMAAAAALAKIGDPQAVRALGDAVKYDDEWPVRKAAAQALGEIGDARAVGPLTAALGDAEERVQACAAEALEAVRSRAGKDEVVASDAAPAEAAPAGDLDAVMTETGPKKIEVIKAIRSKTGLGLAEAKDLADHPPSVILTGVSQAAAEEAVSALKAAGARAEVRAVAEAPVPMDVETEMESATDAAPSERGSAEPAAPATSPEPAPPAVKPSFAPQPVRSDIRLPLAVNLVLTVLTLACCAVSFYCILLADDASAASHICGGLSVLGTVVLLMFTLAGWLGVGRQG